MIKYAHSRRTPPPAYKVGDVVTLSTSHLKCKRPSWILDQKFIGPFQIQQLISHTAVRLTLYLKWQTHSTFNVTEVEPFVQAKCPVDYEHTVHM